MRIRPTDRCCPRRPKCVGFRQRSQPLVAKGHFLLGDHRYCAPLAVVDHVSRYLLACDACSSNEGPPHAVSASDRTAPSRSQLRSGLRNDTGTTKPGRNRRRPESQAALERLLTARYAGGAGPMERHRHSRRSRPHDQLRSDCSGAKDGQRSVQIRLQPAVIGELAMASLNQIGDVPFASQSQCGGDAPKRDQSFMRADLGDEASCEERSSDPTVGAVSSHRSRIFPGWSPQYRWKDRRCDPQAPPVGGNGRCRYNM